MCYLIADRDANTYRIVVNPRARFEEVSDCDIVDVCAVDAQAGSNGARHETSRFARVQQGRLVLRRGQFFELKLQLARQFCPEIDHMELFFIYVGSRFPDGIDVVKRIVVSQRPKTSDTGDLRSWSATHFDVVDNTLSLLVTSSVRAAVGEWKLKICTNIFRGTPKLDNKIFVWDESIYFLFNPYHPDDPTYISSPMDCVEYIELDTGLMYAGHRGNISEIPWIFGQYEEDILEIVCLALRDLGTLDARTAGDPVQVSRMIASIVCGHHGLEGITEVNWSTDKDFRDNEDSRPPWEWSSSVDLMRLYHRRRMPVQYSQCFVLAGLSTTFCRALGIPARCVTGYETAHNADGTLLLDYVFSEKDELIADGRSDCVWSFHVWNEVWMKRKDLKCAAYDGWQVIDATPQEQLRAELGLGPASVKAIKVGEIKREFDTVLAFAKVNGDVVLFRQDAAGKCKETRRLENGIGVCISTKAVLKDERVDITHQYKPADDDEDHAAHSASVRSIQPNLPRNMGQILVGAQANNQLRIDVSDPQVIVGETVKIRGVISNQSEIFAYQIDLTLRVVSRSYTGVYGQGSGPIGKLIKEVAVKRTIEPMKGDEVALELLFVDYAHSVQTGQHLTSILRASSDDGSEILEMVEFGVTMPTIDVNCETTQIVARPFPVKVSLRNPLPVGLTQARFTIEAPGITDRRVLNVERAPGPQEEFEVCTKFTARAAGCRYLVVTFYCTELRYVSARKCITVHSSPIGTAEDGVPKMKDIQAPTMDNC